MLFMWKSRKTRVFSAQLCVQLDLQSWYRSVKNFDRYA